MKAQKRPYRNAAYCILQGPIRPQGIDSYSIPLKDKNMDIYEQKKQYVEKTLTMAVIAVEADVNYLSYDRKSNLYGAIETVTVHYFGGHTDHINVTGNSLLAILHEVIREIDGHHAYGHITKSVKPDEILE